LKIIKAEGIGKKYGDFHLRLDLFVDAGEIIGLVGPNGAGKTTILYILLNIVKADEGKVTIFGMDHIKQEIQIKERTGVVFEEQNFYRHWKISHILHFYASFFPKWDWQEASLLLDKFQLRKNMRFKELSKGMKVKLGLILALSTNAELFLFDEPTTGLDPRIRRLLLDEIQRIHKKNQATMLFSSQNMQDVSNLADRIILVDNGKIRFNEKKTTITRDWLKIVIPPNTHSKVKEIIHRSEVPDGESIIINRKNLATILRDLDVDPSVHPHNLTLDEVFIEFTNLP